MKEKGQAFLEASKYQNMEPTDQSQGKPQPALFKKVDGEIIELPKYETLEIKDIPINKAIFERKSHRKYRQEALTKEELSYALWATQGIKKIVKDRATFRTVPSAGARHAFETVVLVNNVKDLEPGLYFYDAEDHNLNFIERYDVVKDKILAGCLNQRMVVDSAVTFFWVADINRMTYRYGERGYRYLLQDSGHISQNLYLVAEAINCGTCAIGAFDDTVLNEALNFDGKTEAVLYVAPLGKKIHDN